MFFKSSHQFNSLSSISTADGFLACAVGQDFYTYPKIDVWSASARLVMRLVSIFPLCGRPGNEHCEIENEFKMLVKDKYSRYLKIILNSCKREIEGEFKMFKMRLEEK